MPDINPFGNNLHGVRVKPLDYTHQHTPSMKVYHGMSLAVNGSVVGRIQSFQPTNAYNRKVTPVYELSAYTWGQPVDAIPGGSEGLYTASITRGEVWNQELEITCGYTDVWETLSDQTRPFTLNEYWFKGKDVYQIWEYTGAWFTEKNFADAWEAEGEGKVNIAGTIGYVRRQRTV